jgi:hypothetical protein
MERNGIRRIVSDIDLSFRVAFGLRTNFIRFNRYVGHLEKDKK